MHAGLEALPFFAEPVFDGNAHVVEEERHVRYAAEAHLPFVTADLENPGSWYRP